MKPCPHCGGGGQVPDHKRPPNAPSAEFTAAAAFVARLMPGMEFSTGDLRKALAVQGMLPPQSRLATALMSLRRGRKIERVGYGAYRRANPPPATPAGETGRV
mgnify:FL=1